jgi:hypothetical protein
MQVYTLEAGAQMLAVQVEMTTRIVTALKGARARAKTHTQQKATLFCHVRNGLFYQARLRTTSRRRKNVGFLI